MQPGAALLVPGDHLDRYEVLFEIARGGMAAVYAARRAGTRAFDRVLALKVPLPHLRSERRYVELFLNEAKIASVIDHPNVVQVFDLGEHEGVPFLVMEYVRGRALAQVLERVHAPEVRMLLALEVIACAAEGLHAAHTARGPDGAALGIVHRDVSPQNVLVAYAGQVKVADFGIAHAHDRPVATRTGELRGKLQYLAPEQISREEPVSARTDVWSLGVIIWEVVMQRALFLGANDAETLWNVCAKTCPPLELPDFLRGTPLASCVEACLSRSSRDRPSSAAQLAEVLRASLKQGGRTIDLAETMSASFAPEIAADHERLASAFARRDAVSLDNSSAPQEPSFGADADVEPGGPHAPRTKAGTTGRPLAHTPPRPGRSLRRKNAWAWASASLLAGAGAGAIAWMLDRSSLPMTAAEALGASGAAEIAGAPSAMPATSSATTRSAETPSATTRSAETPSATTRSAETPSATTRSAEMSSATTGSAALGFPSAATSVGAPSAASSAAPASSLDAPRVTNGRSAPKASSVPLSPLLGNPYAAPSGSR